MNTCQACGTPIPRTLKVCEECKESGPLLIDQEDDLEAEEGPEEDY